MCGATGVDGVGYCERCQTYGVTPAHADDASTEETIRVYPPSSGGGYYPAAQTSFGGPQPSGPPYPTVSSGPPYDEPVRYDPAVPVAEAAPPQPVRRTSIAPLFMVTVMVIVIVAGAVSIVYILAGDRGGVPRTDAAQPTAAGAPSASTDTGQCLVGVWTLTKWRFTYGDDATFTTETGGGIYRFRADGTGEWDFGSGVAASGTYAGKPSTARITGRVMFEFTTDSGTINYRSVTSTIGIVVYQSSRVVDDSAVEPSTTTAKYTCAGDTLRISSDGDDIEARRR
jgi:hypothetical protein